MQVVYRKALVANVSKMLVPTKVQITDEFYVSSKSAKEELGPSFLGLVEEGKITVTFTEDQNACNIQTAS